MISVADNPAGAVQQAVVNITRNAREIKWNFGTTLI